MQPSSSSSIVYGNVADAAGTNCPRCKREVLTHAIQGCPITNATEKAVLKLLGGIRSCRAPGAGEEGEDSAADRMLGALYARTARGTEYFLIAISGGKLPSGVHGWKTADVVPPDTHAGWTDVYGRSFKFPASIALTDVRKTCAAIKLLLKLGLLYKASGEKDGYKSISIYEAPALARVAKVDRRGRAKRKTKLSPKSRGMLNYCGIDSNYPEAAESCTACQQRVPLFLCNF